MNQTDKLAAQIFFADLLLPLGRANIRKDVHYLNCDRSKASYWQPVVSRTGGMERLSAESSSGPALIELLGQYWREHNDANLPKLIPYLIELRSEIVGSRPPQEEEQPYLSDFVYPIF
jgi:hypothetical protein